MPPLIFSGVVSCIANLLLGLWVYVRNPARRPNRLFLLFCITVSGWSVGSFFENVIPDQHIALAVLRFNYLFGVWLPPVYLNFAYSFTPSTPSRTRILRIAYSIATCLSLALPFHWFIQGLKVLQREPYRYVISSPGPLYGVFFLYFALSMVEVLRAMIAGMQASQGQRRIQFKYLTAANAIAIAAGFEYFSRVFGLLHSPPIDDYLLVAYLAVLAYAIVRHQLLDIRVVIRKSLVYSLLIALITATYLVMVVVMEKWCQGFFGYRSVVATVGVAFLIAIGFNPVRSRLQAFVDRALFYATPAELAAQREQLLDEVRRTDHMKAVALLAAGLAHEVKNPLTAIKTFTESLERHYGDPEFRRKFQRIVGGEVERINSSVQRLLEFAKPMPPRLEPLALATVLEETLEGLGNLLRERRVEVVRRYDATPKILADAQQLKQVFVNLLLNAVQAMRGSGTLEVSTSLREAEVEVVVADTGGGIPPAELSRIFEPFYTTKPDGTGLGLAVVRGIVEEHGGHIRAESEPGRGTRLVLRFPCAI